MSRKPFISTVTAIFLLIMAGSVLAQEPRPTPTNVAPPGGGGSEGDDDGEVRGSISGFIYRDVNRDGRCVNTDIEGEDPIQGIDVQFVSSDGETVITQYSGENGDFGLYAAGQSYWEITVMPTEGLVATTEATVYVPVYVETLNHENVNFCLAEGGANAVINLPGSNSTVLLPESGASAEELTARNNRYFVVIASLALGFMLIIAGYILEQRRKVLQAKPRPIQNQIEDEIR